MRLAVHKFSRKCGHDGYAAELEWYLDDRVEWLNIAMIHGDDLPNALWLLHQATQYIEGVEQSQPQLVGD